MSFDRAALADAIARHGTVARVVVAAVKGSAPREVGAAMLVWDGGQSGTIGGGALEYEATARALECLSRGSDRLDSAPLGPALNQCCGGAVTLLTELWDAARLAAAGETLVARPLPGAAPDCPLRVERLLARARNSGQRPAAGIVDGWMVEPVARPTRALWIWGAGHVGRALVATLAPLPDIAITWIDTAAARFPETCPADVTTLVAAQPAGLADHAPVTAEHLVLTYSHALDLEICHRLLRRGFGFAGLIGSATKWARFRKRLIALGHTPERVAAITCPIGDPALGKHPHQIAIGVAADLVRGHGATEGTRDDARTAS